MLNLAKGEYSGAVSKSFAAEGLLIALTDYHGDKLHSPLHSHENTHLSFSLTGEMVVGRKRHTGIQIANEKFSYVCSGEQHQISLSSQKGKNINVELEPAFLNRYDLDENQLEKLITLPGTSLVMMRLFHELNFQGPAFDDNIHFLVLSMLQDQQAISKHNPPAWAGIVRELLCDSWDKELSLNEIAKIAGVHPVTISKHFSRYFACNLGEYRRRLKLEKALALMASTNIPLTEIAYACGFFDQSHFIRTFKSSTGLLPNSLRSL